MNTGRNTVLACFAIVAVFLIGVFRFAHWPAWASAVLALTFVAATLGLMAMAARRSPSPSPSAESAFTYVPVAPPVVEHRKEHIADVLLPSARGDYFFLFSATVLWSPVPAVAGQATVNLAALAVDAVLTRAREMTERRDPSQASLLRHELGRALGEMREDATGYVRAMAESVQLVLPDRDQQRLDKLAAVRKDEDIWEHERRYEQSKREYLGTDVLKDPGSAVVWWLARNDDQVEKTVQDIGILAQLSCAANNVNVPDSFRSATLDPAAAYPPGPPQSGIISPDARDTRGSEKSAADHFDAFLRAMDLAEGDLQYALFAHQVAELAVAHGRPEVADEMMQRFDVPETAEHPSETADGA